MCVHHDPNYRKDNAQGRKTEQDYAKVNKIQPTDNDTGWSLILPSQNKYLLMFLDKNILLNSQSSGEF